MVQREADQAATYLQIAGTIRSLIASGHLRTGDALPPVRVAADRFGTTASTVSRAYAKLGEEGLVVSRRRAGTRVVASPSAEELGQVSWARVVNEAERYLIEAVSQGFSISQVSAALSVAVSRWKDSVEVPPTEPRNRQKRAAEHNEVRFMGSHDLAAEMLLRHSMESCGRGLAVQFAGSLGGLIGLARGEADIAGVHLWDWDNDSYNVSFVRHVLPGKRVLLLNVAERHLGLIVERDNPLGIQSLEDLAHSGVRFVNRQHGSGTRVWLDRRLSLIGIAEEDIEGIDRIESTHLGVAACVKRGQADVGLGIHAAAAAYGLEFVWLANEPYELAVPDDTADEVLAALRDTLASSWFRDAIGDMKGYVGDSTGRETWVS